MLAALENKHKKIVMLLLDAGIAFTAIQKICKAFGDDFILHEISQHITNSYLNQANIPNWHPETIGAVSRVENFKENLLNKIKLLPADIRIKLLESASEEKQTTLLSKIFHVQRGSFSVSPNRGAFGQLNQYLLQAYSEPWVSEEKARTNPLKL